MLFHGFQAAEPAMISRTGTLRTSHAEILRRIGHPNLPPCDKSSLGWEVEKDGARLGIWDYRWWFPGMNPEAIQEWSCGGSLWLAMETFGADAVTLIEVSQWLCLSCGMPDRRPGEPDVFSLGPHVCPRCLEEHPERCASLRERGFID